MCWECVEEVGGWGIDPEPFEPLVQRITDWFGDAHPTGGVIHVQLDDHNLSDDFMELGYWAESRGCTEHEFDCLAEAAAILAELAKLTEAERNVVVWFGRNRYESKGVYVV